MLPVLVIGGGIAGITTALELAEAGKEVILAEKKHYLGGNVVRMNNYFPKLCPPACGLEINYRRIKNNPRIKIHTGCEVEQITGDRGNFKVNLKQEAQFVNDFCTNCGDCVKVCPEERPDQFNEGFTKTKAIYIEQPQSFPQKHAIDEDYCPGSSCAKCLEACQYDAIDLTASETRLEFNVHAVVNATGWKSNDAAQLEGLSYVNSKDVVNNMEFERLLSVIGPGEGKLARPSDGKTPSKIAFVQCAGSRDRNYLPYCSAVCCSASLKHALNVVEANPEAIADIYYIDMRVTGRNEDFLKRVEQQNNIHLIKGKVARIEDVGEELEVVAEDIEQGLRKAVKYDMVVLATGLVPSARIPGFNYNETGFCDVEQKDGLIPAATAFKPMDVSASVKDATAAAISAMK